MKQQSIERIAQAFEMVSPGPCSRVNLDQLFSFCKPLFSVKQECSEWSSRFSVKIRGRDHAAPCLSEASAAGISLADLVGSGKVWVSTGRDVP